VHNWRRIVRPLSCVLLVAAIASSCRAAGETHPALIRPGAPGEATRSITPAQAVDLARVGPTAADVRFMQGMIGHHAQALEMTALLPSRTAREDMHLLAHRIELSQADEITLMQRWLQVRGAEVPDVHAHHAHDAVLMPGMLTPDEMDRLAMASGAAFDRLFLEFMIKHHDGALVMVDQLFSTAGAAQEPEIFAFASDVDTDQRIEIDRMSAMLGEMLK